MRAEAWWASRGGSSDERNAREGGRGGRGVRRVRREGGAGRKGESGGQLHCSTQHTRQQTERLRTEIKILIL